MFIWIYRLIFLPVVILASPRLFWRMRRRGGYADNFGSRFGLGLSLPPKTAGRRRIWIQAVSLGEMLAIEPLLRRLAEDSRNEIFLTATTSTGYALARERFSGLLLGLAYFPLDFWPFSRRVWRAVDPDLAICAETELWPEHIRQAARRGVPLVLVNARLSDRSYRYAFRLRRWIGGELRRVSRVLAGSEQDRERFLSLGLPAERIEVTGNLKVDVAIDPLLDEEEKRALRKELGLGEGLVLLGSSTWPGEEAMLLEALRRIREREAEASLILVPRHGERRGEILDLLRAKGGGLRWHFRSRGPAPGPVDILVGDTHGELRKFTQLADLAWVGKSLPPHREGQTPVECGLLGVPMVFGQGMSNFRSIEQQLLAFGAARQASDAGEALETLAALSRSAEEREAMGRAGRLWAKSSRGALERTLEGIERELDRASDRSVSAGAGPSPLDRPARK